jgi:hypothetical protein
VRNGLIELFPADAGYRAFINGLKLDFLFSGPVWIKAFRLAVVVNMEYVRKIVDANSASDTHVLIDKCHFCHIVILLFIGAPLDMARCSAALMQSAVKWQQ